METKTFYSRNDEEYRATAPEEILDELWYEGELAIGAKYYECEFKPMEFKSVLNAETILDDATDRAYDIIGEAMDGDDPFGVSDEAKQQLNAMLKPWAEEHIDLSSYWVPVGKTKELVVTEQDVARYAS